MGRGGMLRVSVPIMKKQLEESGKAVTLMESAEVLGMSPSAALGVLDSMEAIGIVQRVRMRKHLYFLKDTYDEERIEAMILEAEERDKSGNGRSRARSKYDPIIDRFLEGEDDLVRVDIVGLKHAYVAVVLHQRIKARELCDRIKASAVNNCSYLEKK